MNSMEYRTRSFFVLVHCLYCSLIHGRIELQLYERVRFSFFNKLNKYVEILS